MYASFIGISFDLSEALQHTSIRTVIGINVRCTMSESQWFFGTLERDVEVNIPTHHRSDTPSVQFSSTFASISAFHWPFGLALISRHVVTIPSRVTCSHINLCQQGECKFHPSFTNATKSQDRQHRMNTLSTMDMHDVVKKGLGPHKQVSPSKTTMHAFCDLSSESTDNVMNNPSDNVKTQSASQE